MARTRAIKPEFWDDEKLAKLSRDSRLTFIGMWSVSDDYGVCKGNSVYLKNKIFPYDEIQVKQFEGWLAELENICVIKPFSHHNEKFFHIKNFHKHQKIDHPSRTRNPKPTHEIREGARETFGSVSRNTPDETEYKQKLETETEFKQKLETTIASSDEKTDRLPPEENESSGIQPDMLAEQPATASGDLAPQGKECARITVEVSTGSDPPTDTAQKRGVYMERIVEIVDYFNQKAGTSYKHDTPETVKCIVARLRCGFTVDDFKAVIDKKTVHWKDDPKMCMYIRPITLFSTKFESYLNELNREKGNNGHRKTIHGNKQSTVGKTEEPPTEGIYGAPDYVFNLDDTDVEQKTA